jgi:hypothetical protein
MTTKAKSKPKLSKQDRAILKALPEGYQRALLYVHTAQAEESVQHGHKPLSLAQLLQSFIFDWLKGAQDRDAAARTAFEILIASQFITSLKAQYEAWVAAGKPEVANGR